MGDDRSTESDEEEGEEGEQERRKEESGEDGQGAESEDMQTRMDEADASGEDMSDSTAEASEALSAEMAEDAFQATFLQVHLKCDQFEEGRRFRPWLYTIATNQAIDAQRRNKRHRNLSLDRSPKGEGNDEVGSLVDLLVSKELDPESRLDANQRRDWIRDALDQLPEQFRTAVQLIYYQGLKYREAAEILGIPVGTVKSRLHTAILKLNQMWMDSQSAQPNE